MADVLQFQSNEEKLTRGQKLWEDLKERRGTTPISFERAWLITQAYKETEKQPAFLRRAAAFDKIMRELPIFVTDGQLLCGDFSANLAAAEIFPENIFGADILTIKIHASGFLYHMARNIVAAAVEVGRHRLSIENFARIFDSGRRDLFPATAPAHGLCLEKVFY